MAFPNEVEVFALGVPLVDDDVAWLVDQRLHLIHQPLDPRLGVVGGLGEPDGVAHVVFDAHVQTRPPVKPANFLILPLGHRV